MRIEDDEIGMEKGLKKQEVRLFIRMKDAQGKEGV